MPSSATAASAVIRNKTLIEARDELLEILADSLDPAVRARDRHGHGTDLLRGEILRSLRSVRMTPHMSDALCAEPAAALKQSSVSS